MPSLKNPGAEIVRRRGDEAEYVFVINHSDRPVTLPESGYELITDSHVNEIEVPPGAVRVLRTQVPAT